MVSQSGQAPIPPGLVHYSTALVIYIVFNICHDITDHHTKSITTNATDTHITLTYIAA